MTRSTKRAVVLVALCAALAAGLAVEIAAGPSRPAFADDLDDRIAALRELVKSGDAQGAAKAVRSLRRKREKRVDDALLGIARGPEADAAACEAMLVLGMHADSSYLTWVRSRLGDKKMLEEHPDRFHAMLDSLPPAGAALKPMLRSLADCGSDHLKTKPETSRRVVVAYTSAGSEKFIVDQLIDWLDKLETESGGGGRRGGLTAPPPLSGTTGSGGGAANTQPVKDAIQSALRAMTGGDGTDHDTWAGWWSANKGSFKPSPPRKPDTDWGSFQEYVDDTYDFLLKKPGGEAAWSYGPLDGAGGRVRMQLETNAGLVARVDAWALPKGRHADPAAFAKSLEEAWRKSDFSDFFKDGEPAASAKQVAGRDAACLAARGVGTGSWKDWDGYERRAIVLFVGDVALVFDAAVRVSLEEPKRKAVWEALEGVTFVAE